jgi:hypothetical protein
MARAVSDAIAQARGILQDEREPYRYPDTDLITYLNDSFTEMRRIRPDIFVVRFPVETPFYDETTIDEDFPVSSMYFTTVVNYIVFRTGVRDDQSVNEGRAQAFYQMFLQQLMAA